MQDSSRRKIVKSIVTGAATLAGFSVLPDRWIKPIVGTVMLPAHAKTSGGEDIVASTKRNYNTSKMYSLRPVTNDNKRYTWLNNTGSTYGGRVMFDFGSCGELTVPNAAVTHGADGNTSNHNQAFYFCGTDFPKEAKEYNADKASVFSPPNCKADTVIMYYNKDLGR